MIRLMRDRRSYLRIGLLFLIVPAVLFPLLIGMRLDARQSRHEIAGWGLSAYASGGDTRSIATDYERSLDTKVKHRGKASAHIRAKVADTKQFDPFSQAIRADAYRGKRVRLSGYLKSRGVAQGAGLWLRIDGSNSLLGFDNMQNRPVTGTTDWKRYDVVLDVPQQAICITFGTLLTGPGEIWADDLKLEAVDSKTTPTTNMLSGETVFGARRKEIMARYRSTLAKLPLQPVNMDFEQ